MHTFKKNKSYQKKVKDVCTVEFYTNNNLEIK